MNLLEKETKEKKKGSAKMKREEKKNEKERVEQTDNDNTRQCVVQVVLKKKSVRLLAYRSDISSS